MQNLMMIGCQGQEREYLLYKRDLKLWTQTGKMYSMKDFLLVRQLGSYCVY